MKIIYLNIDGEIVIPEREESNYLPYKDGSDTNKNNDEQDQDLTF